MNCNYRNSSFGINDLQQVTVMSSKSALNLSESCWCRDQLKNENYMIILITSYSLKNRFWYFMKVYMLNYAPSTKISEQSLLVSLYDLKPVFFHGH